MADTRIRRMIILIVVVALVALFAYTPTRFFIKFTILFAIPSVLLFRWWLRLRRFSISWVLIGLVLAGLLGLYGMQMVKFPEKLAVREIVREGDILMAQGRYDEAIEKYKEMEKLNKDKAREKLEVISEQKKFYDSYVEARELVKRGEKGKARELLKGIPRTAGVYSEARKLLSQIGED